MKRGLVVVALAAAPLFADEVHLRGGGRLTGEIVEQTADSVTVNVGGGTMSVRASSVVKIEKSRSPMQEYRERAAAIPAGDAESWRALAQWASGEGQATLAGQAWSQVVAILPDDAEGNRALGRVRHAGAWVTEEESYRARGFVEFEGEWMMPAERQAILDERRAREESYRQAEQARLQAEQEAERERQAQEAAERKDFLHGGLPQVDDTVYSGWGTYPVYWPARPVLQPHPGHPVTLPAGGRR